MTNTLLSHIEWPADLRQLLPEQLPQLVAELRQHLIDVVSAQGGHFGAGLGVVELTVALHHAFDTPNDRLIWDVGHQAYAHKMLTGRRAAFTTNRRWQGISGFPSRSESIYDAFGTGHASTSISAALGMAIAARQQGLQQRWHIAVIGDGALTGGMAFEALNQAATEKVNLLIVLNDNAMSIDPNVGGLQEHLNALRVNASARPSIFEKIGIPYAGPVDGHYLPALLQALEAAKKQGGVQVLHVLTTKGKGFAPAEAEQTHWHATGLFDKISGTKQAEKSQLGPKYQDVFGYSLLELAQQFPNIVGITPAMPSGSSMIILQNALPQRCFDVGIAEAHAVTLAAGMAAEGLKPFCAIYSTFLQRAYDQLIHDVALQQLPVVFCIDRAGLVGADGPTHHGAFDLAYLRCIPNMVVAAPRNEVELRNLLYSSAEYEAGPIAIRYPRGNGQNAAWQQPFTAVEIGKAEWLRTGGRTLVISVGPLAEQVQQALADLPEVAHVDLRFVKPLDTEMLAQALQYNFVVTVEDGCVAGGAGSAIAEWLLEHGYQGRFKSLGLPDAFIPHGSPEELYRFCGLDVAGIKMALQG
ncbi:MAG: 1-deoxy-D-xylulose-5-phosphate synthase [Sphingobacteriaceae bacterium]|nr:1-deoxy-D-xylulose-5-phosphate synthase [Sphingobacteriaceae bacterium]